MSSKFPRVPRQEQLPNWLFIANRLWIALLTITLLGAISLGQVGQATDTISVEGLLDCTNDIRAQNGQKKLYLNEQLHRAAQQKQEDMEKDGYWAHQNPETGVMGWEFIDQAGYYYATAGENLAIGYASSEAVCEAWKKSPSHFENLINPHFQEVGFAFKNVSLNNNKTGTLVVQLFATKAGFEKDFTTPPECSYTIDKSLYVVSPTCEVSAEKVQTIVMVNPRKQKIDVSIDGKKVAYKSTQNGKYSTFTLESPLSLGSHEITIQKAFKNKRLKPKTAQIKFIVAAPETSLISAVPWDDFLFASIFNSKSALNAFPIVIFALLSALAVMVWRQTKRTKK